MLIMGDQVLIYVNRVNILFKAIISNLMYEEFEKGNCALSDIYAAMLHVSLSFGWLAYLQFEKGS